MPEQRSFDAFVEKCYRVFGDNGEMQKSPEFWAGCRVVYSNDVIGPPLYVTDENGCAVRYSTRGKAAVAGNFFAAKLCEDAGCGYAVAIIVVKGD